MNVALKKINARAKQLKKLHPGKKYKTLQKQAGAEYKSGKLKTKRKVGKRPAAVKAKSRKPRARAIVKTKTVYRTRTVKVRSKPRRKVSGIGSVLGGVMGKGSSLMPLALVAAAGVAAYFILKPRTQVQQYVPTGNYQRDQSANNVIAYATAAGLGITAIAKLIAALNSSPDSTVTAAGSNPNAFLTTLQLD